MTEQNEKKPKREYRKGNPLTLTERTKRYKDKQKKNNREMRLFIPTDLGNQFTDHCREIKKSRSEVVSKLIEDYIKSVGSLY
ncbi:Replication regulatory protein [Candidatus Regiella insecticola 5.15]|uniref:Protein CopB n=1 Tax=Candidatus Regiella insecticola 5.15 TaxID=1005043 RepID=G2H1Q1_9ENTR|nr:RepB family protein [Candidatus Regiella insecticola]EGY28101.1 Replication regulatory protein [Candidatus Regiella insecticola 5.15]